VAPGYQADLLLLDDLERFAPATVLKRGRPVEEIPRPEVPDWVKHTVRIQPVANNDFQIEWKGGGKARVIGLVEGQIVTEALEEEPKVEEGLAVADVGRDLAKIAVVERHLGTGRMGLGFVRGFGLQRGAMASTIAHDAHNIVVVGVDDGDMARAVQRLAEMGGGLVVIADRGVQAELPLPVAGLLSDEPVDQVVEQSRACVAAARELGCRLQSPFQSMAFLALSVIPKLKITDRGLVDVDRFELVPLRAN
jgi:adenine deaminase